MTKHNNLHNIGLEKHLNLSAHKHNGWDYDDFCRMIKGKPSVASLARIFGVHPETMRKWVAVYHDEQNKHN